MSSLTGYLAEIPPETRRDPMVGAALADLEAVAIDRASARLQAEDKGHAKPYLHALETDRLHSAVYEEVLADVQPLEGKLGSLYLHVPYCTKRCSWCHYYKEVGVAADDIERFPEYLLRELHLILGRLQRPRLTAFTVHYGGGTPTLLTPAQLERLVLGVNEFVALDEEDEVAVECDPEDITEEKMACLKALGVNRVSLGIQSFDEELLKLLRRGHDGAGAVRGYECAVRAGFKNINIDLMYGMPGHGWQKWLNDLRVMLDLMPESVTVYATRPDPRDTLEKYTEFPDEAWRWLMHFVACHAFLEAGYTQFSPNQFIRSRQGACLAKEQRNRCGNILGLGPLAHSILGNWFYFNRANLAAYRGRIGAGALCEIKGDKMSMEESKVRYVQFALKLSGVNKGEQNNGVSREGFHARFGEPLEDCFGQQMDLLDEVGLIRQDGDAVHLTLPGAMLQRQVMKFLAGPR